MGKNGTDKNQFDFFNDGSGKGNCFEGNTSSSFYVSPTASHPQSFLYPSCPAPNSAGTGTNQGDGANNLKGQVGALACYVLADPPCSQEDSVAATLASGVQGHHADRHQELRQVHEAGAMRALTRIGILVALAALRGRRPRRHRRCEPARQGEPAGEGQGPRRLLQADQRQDQEEQEGQMEVGPGLQQPQRDAEEGPEGREEEATSRHRPARPRASRSRRSSRSPASTTSTARFTPTS